MKALKIIGIVVGIHAFALLIIFANPGCSTTKAAAQSDTASKDDDGSGSPVVQPAPAASATAPSPSSDASAVVPAPAGASSAASAVAPAPGAAATPSPGITYTPVAASTTILYSPTRPGTAAASALEEQPVEDVTPATTYTVVKGDSLSAIAKHFHTTRAALAAANHLKTGSTIHIGQKLLIPAATSGGKAHSAGSGGASASPAGDEGGRPSAGGSAPRAGAEGTRYVVKPGESLGVIARHFGVRVGDIAAANSIADPKKIRPGQELIIPARSSSGAAHASSAPRPSAAAPSEGTSESGATDAASPPPVLLAPQGSASAPAATTPPPSTDSDGRPTVSLPSPSQDLDAGLKPSSTTDEDVPVVKVEDAGKP